MTDINKEELISLLIRIGNKDLDDQTKRNFTKKIADIEANKLSQTQINKLFVLMNKINAGDYDEDTKERTKLLNEIYILLEGYYLNGNEKFFLGTNKKCRFCGKSELDTTFKNISHAIPNFTGNRTLFSNYECDLCNNKFGKLESHMANFMNLRHTLTAIKGKNNIPSFKTISGKSRIDHKDRIGKIKYDQEDSFFSLDEEDKTATFTATTRSYVPVAIYKCLTKMALTIMPEDELIYFEETLKWISDVQHDSPSYNLRSLYADLSTTVSPLNNGFSTIYCQIYKNRDTRKFMSSIMPYMVFVLAYGSFAFQIHIPLCSRDIQLTDFKQFPFYIPTSVDYHFGSSFLQREVLDLNGKEKVVGEKQQHSLKWKRNDSTNKE